MLVVEDPPDDKKTGKEDGNDYVSILQQTLPKNEGETMMTARGSGTEDETLKKGRSKLLYVNTTSETK